MDGWMDGWVGGWMDGWMDGTQKCSRILLNIFSDEGQVILMCGNLENLRKTFFIGKKIQLQLSKSGGFFDKIPESKSSFFLYFFSCLYVYIFFIFDKKGRLPFGNMNPKILNLKKKHRLSMRN